jgi:small-conductance mechanosensitive channel
MRAFVADYLQHVHNPIIKAVLLLVFYILLAKTADIIIDKAVRRLTKLTKSELDDKIIDLTHRPVFYTVLFIGCMHAVSILNPSGNILFYIRGFLYSLLAVIWCVYVIRISNILIEKKVVRVVDVTGLGKEVTPLIENVWKVLIIVAALMVILSIWKINIPPLLASAGIAGVAIALAAKDTLANFFGGISIFLDKPYRIGDYIVLEGGERGEVVNIGIRSTRIKTRDDILISIPNSIIASAKIINESAPVPNFRMRIPASVAYGSDIDKVEKILLDIAGKNENILKTPEPRVRFRTFGESSLNFELLCWAKEPVVRGITNHEINREIYKRFHQEGVVIPFPHRTVYVREERDWEP